MFARGDGCKAPFAFPLGAPLVIPTAGGAGGDLAASVSAPPGALIVLFLAILSHALVDFVAVALPRVLGRSTTIALVLEGIVCAFGLLAVRITGVYASLRRLARRESNLPFRQTMTDRLHSKWYLQPCY